jgi:tetratricopeptide (TPR) repeat protein
MLRPKKKISKKELKEDALITKYVQVTTFYEKHKKNISIGITALVVLVIASLVYINNRTANNEQALADLGKVYTYYDNGQYQLAIDGVPERNIPGLKTIVDNYGGTPSGNLAKFYVANSYYHLGKHDDALKQFVDFSPAGQLLSVSKLSGIAGCYEAKGMYADAADYFEEAATKYANDISAPENMNNAARDYALAGKKDKAIELYKRLKTRFPTSSFGREVDRYIAQLSV